MGIWLKIAWKQKSGPKVPYPRSYPISTARGGHVHLEVPWEWHLGSKLKIYVETIYCEHFVFYWKKNFLVIFQTWFTENCQFFKDFDQNLLLPKSWNGFNRNCQKIYHKLDFGHLLLIPFHNLGKTRFWSKSTKIGNFHGTKSEKWVTNIFFQ